MPRVLSFNSRVLCTDDNTATASAFNTTGNYGHFHETFRQPSRHAMQEVHFHGTAGLEMKALDLAPALASSHTRTISSEGLRSCRITFVNRTAMESWLDAVDSSFSNSSNRQGTLVAGNETLSNMWWLEWSPGVATARAAYAPGGTSRALVLPFRATFVSLTGG